MIKISGKIFRAHTFLLICVCFFYSLIYKAYAYPCNCYTHQKAYRKYRSYRDQIQKNTKRCFEYGAPPPARGLPHSALEFTAFDCQFPVSRGLGWLGACCVPSAHNNLAIIGVSKYSFSQYLLLSIK